MMPLASPTLRPSATSELGSHNSTPKLTSPHARAAKVSAIVVIMRPCGVHGTWRG
jgi:hypothetical protein